MKSKVSRFWFYLIVFLIILIASLQIISLINKCYPKEVQIPNREQVKSFCGNEGYDGGWLDVDCGINKVKCYRKIDSSTSRYDCLDWDANGGKDE